MIYTQRQKQTLFLLFIWTTNFISVEIPTHLEISYRELPKELMIKWLDHCVQVMMCQRHNSTCLSTSKVDPLLDSILPLAINFMNIKIHDTINVKFQVFFFIKCQYFLLRSKMTIKFMTNLNTGSYYMLFTFCSHH